MQTILNKKTSTFGLDKIMSVIPANARTSDDLIFKDLPQAFPTVTHLRENVVQNVLYSLD